MNSIEKKKQYEVYRNRSITHIVHEALFRRGYEKLSVFAEFQQKKINEILGISSKNGDDQEYCIGNIMVNKGDKRMLTYPIFAITYQDIVAPHIILTILDNIETEIRNSESKICKIKN